jgi:HD-GYP domain-containing protein (c-di-GMP phosphodiesterase class II)
MDGVFVAVGRGDGRFSGMGERRGAIGAIARSIGGRMLRVPIAYAKPGMVLAMPILHPRRPDTVLLNDGIELDGRSIDRLAEIHLRDLWIRMPGMEFLCEYYCPEVFRAQASLTAKIGGALDMAREGSHARFEFSEYRSAVMTLVDRLILFPRSALFMQELADRDQPALRHAASVCMMSVLMGLKLDDYLIVERSRLSSHGARDVASLGVGAMMHDIGMLRLDPIVVERWKRTRDETDPEWRAHVSLGYEMVKDSLGPVASAAVLHHHQRFDGSGFPKRVRLDGKEEALSGSEIHVFARIVACADVFDRLRHGSSDGVGGTGEVTPTVRVLGAMLREPYASWIDPMVIKALLAVVPAYAPGTLVRLNTGERCVVTEWFADDPCRPNVQVVGELESASTARERVRFALAHDATRWIAEAEGQDVSADNFYPDYPGQFDLRLAERALFNSAAKASGGRAA